MKRRLSVQNLQSGMLTLEASQAHYLRDVLRLGVGDAVELFDAAGAAARAVIIRCGRQGVELEVAHVRPPPTPTLQLTVAAAVPKGQRADWMVEKLSELGVDRFIPLQCERSVVIPGGRNKIERWERLASEAARQSRRRGVMRILETAVPLQLLEASASQAVWHLSTATGVESLAAQRAPSSITLLIGPEGGWSESELALFAEKRIPALSLTRTILRIETAAVAAAAVVLCNAETSSPAAPVHS